MGSENTADAGHGVVTFVFIIIILIGSRKILPYF